MDYTSQSGPTYLGNIISAADNEAIYDENVKLILADKSVLSWILRRCTNEFASESLDTIRACIDGEPAVDQLLVAPHLTNMQKRHTDRLETLSQEDTSPSEGKITFDVRFKVRVPGSDTRIEMIINVEAQKDYYPGYPLVSRGIFYASRMISAQLNKDFVVPDYGRIKKVYSIWICFNPPEYMKDLVISYEILPQILHGHKPDRLTGYDLMRVVTIGLVDNIDSYQHADKTIRMLSTLFSVELNAEQKKRRMQEEFKFQMTREIEERSALMCNVSALIVEKGLQKGMTEGMQKGIKEGMQKGIKEGIKEGIKQEKANSLLTAAQLSKEYGIPMETALSKLKARKEWEDSAVDRVVQLVYMG